MNATGPIAACLVALAAQPAAAQVYKPGGDVTAPHLVKEVKPGYTPEAMRLGVEGGVMLLCTVEVDGTVSDVRVVKPLEPSLDEKTVVALRQWHFEPGTKDGKPVRVEVEVEMTFRLDVRPRLGSPEVFTIGQAGVSAPMVVSEVEPAYPEEAMKEGVQGTVELECVVLPSGRVGDMRVTRPLAHLLDLAARRALKQWKFEPGRKDGQPVPVAVRVEMTFALK